MKRIPKTVRKYLKYLGAKGGRAAAKVMTSEELSLRGRKAAAARVNPGRKKGGKGR